MTLPRPLCRLVSPALLSVALAIGGCADVGPVLDAAPGTEGAACDASDCLDGLDCLAGVCVARCGSALDCGGRQCLPSPQGDAGWCALSPGEGDPTRPGDPAAPGGPDDALEKPPLGDPQPDGSAPDQPDGKRPDDDAPPSPPDQPPPPGAGERTPDEPAPDEPAPDAPAPDEPVPEPPWGAPDEPADEPPADTPPPAAPCQYPGGLPAIGVGQLMPNLSWRGVYDGQGNPVDFDLEAFHCDPTYDRYSILAVIVGAEWCGACSQYLGELRAQAAAADQAGALFLYVEVEDNNYQPASHAVARRVVDRHAPGAPGLRIGDGQTQPAPGAIANSPLVRSYPTMFAVRRADMRIIGEGRMNWAQLARQEMQANPPNAPAPDLGGGQPDDPGVAPPAGCEEEAAEPNDAAQQAATLSSGQSIVGGVCNGTADYYRIDHPGFWSLELEFAHAQGDLDVYVWDPIRNAPAVGLDGNPVGSATSTDDELVIYAGPQVVMITGYQGARAPYRLSLQGF